MEKGLKKERNISLKPCHQKDRPSDRQKDATIYEK